MRKQKLIRPADRRRGKRPTQQVGGRRVPSKGRQRRSSGQATRRASSVAPAAIKRLFPEAVGRAKRYGRGGIMAVIRRIGASAEVRLARVGRFSANPRAGDAVFQCAKPDKLARLLGGLAHRDRIRIAQAIATGAATHRVLSERVGLKVGPLYHHLRALERGGLLNAATRNSYELSEVGMIVLQVVVALGSLANGGNKAWQSAKIQMP